MEQHLVKEFLIWLIPLTLIFSMCHGNNHYENLPSYKNPNLPLHERVNDLISRITLEEKISQMVHDAPAIERLDIPKYNWWNECLHGVARAGRATVFPQAIGLAATWDTDLMSRVSTAISDEARAKHHEFVRRGKRGIYQGLTFWSPNINLFRDPRWGRGMETYGEDPFLTGRLAIEFIKGLQGNDPKYLKLVATAKHYVVHSGPEPDRHHFNALVDDRDFRESYLPHFRASIMEGKAYSVMCAYNRFRSEACCGSYFLLNSILRDDWGFEGYVVSDCGAIWDIYTGHRIVETAPEAAALCVKSGCDLNCGNSYPALKEAVEKGLISEDEINIAVKRLFKARMKLGMFDPPEMVPYAKIPYEVVDCQKHRELALEAARKSIVLLKNENNLLPLKKELNTIAVIGPNADDVEALLGNYNGTPVDPVTLLRGIKEKVSHQTKVLYAQGCELAENMPSFEIVPPGALFTSPDQKKAGLLGEYFDNREFKGTPAFTRIDQNVDFNWWDGAPRDDFDDDNFGVRWTGYLTPPVTGEYYLGANGFNAFNLYYENKLLLQFNASHHSRTIYEKVYLEAGKSYKIKLEFYERAGDAHIQFLWRVPGRDLEAEALEIAKQADVVLVCMGLHPRLEGEEMEVPVPGFKGGDRLTLDLPARQENLLKKIHELGKPIVLILLNGSALAINWAQKNLPAILEAWYPGQAAGTAIADVLFGDYNPAGKLPVTFYKSTDQLPPFSEYQMKGRTYRYFEDEPLYSFGFGLSYTKFNYSDLVLPEQISNGENIEIAVKVQNSGNRDGEEVVQLYVRDVVASAPVPLHALQGFERIFLKAGEKKTVKFVLKPEQLSLITESGERVVEPGEFDIFVGGRQPGKCNSTSNFVRGKINVVGDVYVIQDSQF